jgi:ribosomal protein L24
MSTNRSLHKKGARIRVLRGKHNGKTGTIAKANPMRHVVIFDDGQSGYVQRSNCYFFPDDSPAKIHQEGRVISSTTPLKTSPARHASNVIQDLSQSSTIDRPSLEFLHGSEVTSQVLVDLLANTLANMRLGDDDVDEWTQHLRDRIIYFRHSCK